MTDEKREQSRSETSDLKQSDFGKRLDEFFSKPIDREEWAKAQAEADAEAIRNAPPILVVFPVND